jgi:hypothetical protein
VKHHHIDADDGDDDDSAAAAAVTATAESTVVDEIIVSLFVEMIDDLQCHGLHWSFLLISYRNAISHAYYMQIWDLYFYNFSYLDENHSANLSGLAARTARLLCLYGNF